MTLPGGRAILAATVLLFCAQCLHPHSQVNADPSMMCLPLLSLPFLVPVAMATADELEDVDSVLSKMENDDIDRDLPIVTDTSLAPPSDADDDQRTTSGDTSSEAATVTAESSGVVMATVTNATMATEEPSLPKLSVVASSEDALSVGEVVGTDSASGQISSKGHGPEGDGDEEGAGQGEDIEPTPVDSQTAQPMDVVGGGEGETPSLELTGTQELDDTPPPGNTPSDDVPTPTPEGEGEGRDKDDDDVPTFEEFKQQKMIEQEAAKRNSNDVPAMSLKRDKSNNYASVDCGAKVVAQNQEAQNPDAVLKENKDLYLLNPCSVDIWFVIEMCDFVAVHTIEIASFELFSSMPRDFGVYSSEGYPTAEWTLIGEFRASDVRTVQTFPLTETVYAKYIKIEMLSHFGNDYYCPISLVRVLGASIMEEFQEAEQRQATPPKAADESVSTVATLSISEDDELAFVDSDVNSDRNGTTFFGKAKNVVLGLLGQVNGLMNNGNGNEQEVAINENGNSQEALANGNGITDEVVANGSEEMSSTQEDSPELSPEAESKEILVTTDAMPAVCSDEGGEEEVEVEQSGMEEEGEGSSTAVLSPLPSLQTAHTPERDLTVASTSDSNSIELLREPLPSGHADSSDVPPNGGPQEGGVGAGPAGGRERADVLSVNQEMVMDQQEEGEGEEEEEGEGEGDPEKEKEVEGEGVALSTTDQVGMATLGQLEIPPVSDVSMDGSSLESGQSDQPLPQPQVTPPLMDSGVTESIDIGGQQEDSAPPTPEPHPLDGEELVDRKNGHLQSAAIMAPPTLEGVGEGGGDEPPQPGPPTVSAERSVDREDMPNSEQEVEPVISPTPSTSDYGNGDVNSSSASGGVGKSQQEKSVLIRLSNRVRELEENMSLFTSYLDQLSNSMKKNKNKTEEINRKLTLLGEQLGVVKMETTHHSYILRQVHKELRNLLDVLQTLPSHRTQDPFPLLLQSMVVAGLTTLCVLLTAYILCGKR